jgi:hypothetical protein
VVPFLLRPKRHADFRSDYAVGLAQLAIMLSERSSTTSEYTCSNGHTSLEEAPDHPPLSSSSPLCYTDDTMKQFGRVVEVNVELQIPYIGKIVGVWKPDEREQDASWEMYIELVTRISVAELTPGSGLLRESLASLYSMFTTTREILRTHGPAVARPKEESELSFGYLAISILNFVLRPVLAKWHPLLLDYEHQKEASVSALQHEKQWEKAEELRNELNQVRFILIEYTDVLARISGVPTNMLE